MSTVVAMAHHDYYTTLKALGYDAATSTNLSDSLKLNLEQPRLAYVNLVSLIGMPDSKNADFRDWIEYYDPVSDVFFQKRVLANLQGQSSTHFPKRNVAISFCDEIWGDEDDVPRLTFDGWVRQDAFHLKAFYGDWLRGVGIVGYQLYDEMEQTLPEGEQRIWQRAGVDAPSKARCYPDGFPCALYLNGEFYGIYAWQLKKHRRNMGQESDVETHIHLEGNLGENQFWSGNVIWENLDVRNPKGLTTIAGTEYDGNAPMELADGPVKDAIVNLSVRCQQYSLLRAAGASDEEIREAIAADFDVISLVNYIAFSLVVSNYDGFIKNWQWVTYDGQQWAVAPYDLDCTFGNYHEGTFVFPANLSYLNSTYTMNKTRHGIIAWMWDYYYQEIADCYMRLRSTGVFAPDHIIDMLHAWHERVGEDLYDAEWQRWPESLCISETIISPGWTTTEDWLPYYGLNEWNPNRQYLTGDRCRLDGRIWIATAPTKGVRPYVQLGYTDSFERLENWVSERIELLDGYFGYFPTDGHSVAEDKWLATTPGRRGYTYYNILGQPLRPSRSNTDDSGPHFSFGFSSSGDPLVYISTGGAVCVKR